nr:hypothetical protein [bacterium]
EWDTEKNWSRLTTAEVDSARIAEYRNIWSGDGIVAGYSSTSWRPWMDEGTWVNVNGERVWASQGDFVWMNNRWVWSDDTAATFRFEDDRFDVDRSDWGISVDNDRWDMDVDRDKIEIDPDRFNIDSDRLKIETDLD